MVLRAESIANVSAESAVELVASALSVTGAVKLGAVTLSSLPLVGFGLPLGGLAMMTLIRETMQGQ